MDSTRDSIRRILLGLLASFCLGVHDCSAGGMFSKAGPTVSEQALRVIAEMAFDLRLLNTWLTTDEPAEKLDKVASDTYSFIHFDAESRRPYSYYSHNMSSMCEYGDVKNLIKEIRIHIGAGNEHVAKDCLSDFITTLEDTELGYDVKALEFGKLFIGLNKFYGNKFVRLGFMSIKGRGTAPVLSRYSEQEEHFDKAFALTLNVVQAFVYVILRELYTKSLDPRRDPVSSMLAIEFTHGYKLLAPFMNPKLPSVSDTGCSDGAACSGEARLSESPDNLSDGSSESFDSDASGETREDVVDPKPAAGRRSEIVSPFMPV